MQSLLLKSFQTLTLDQGPGSFLSVCLNRPAQRNAFNPEMIQELREVFETAKPLKTLRGIWLMGHGSVFCSGGDIQWLKRGAEYSEADNKLETQSLIQFFEFLNRYPKPLMAVVHGAVMGGGIGLISVCDVVLAERQTLFAFSEAKMGLIPAVISPFVMAKIGPSHTRRFFVTAETFKSKTAQSIGLVHEVFDSREERDELVQTTTQAILQCSPSALREAKQLIYDLHWLDRTDLQKDYATYVSHTLARLRTEPEAQEGMKAFLEKRKPAWAS
jgi:methylglutaconyl-CoA hydratase